MSDFQGETKWQKVPEGWMCGRWLAVNRKTPIQGYDPDYRWSLFTMTKSGKWRLVEVSNQIGPLKQFAASRGLDLVNLPD